VGATDGTFVGVFVGYANRVQHASSERHVLMQIRKELYGQLELRHESFLVALFWEDRTRCLNSCCFLSDPASFP